MPPASLFQRLFAPKPAARAAAVAPEGLTLYAIGDIHGRSDLLSAMLAAVAEDRREESASVVICVGDYVDRGRGSREVVELLLAFAADSPIGGEAAGSDGPVRFLRGNHDQSLLDFLREPMSGPGWCDFGGRETLASYGVQTPASRTDEDGWSRASRDLAAALPPAHLSFFEGLEYACEYGDYFFAHAGVRPGVPLDEQDTRDLMWIRQPFIEDTRRLPKLVVHGHTPTETVHFDRRRIGIDTGAYATGVLTALKLKGSSRALLQTSRPAAGPTTVSLREIL